MKTNNRGFTLVESMVAAAIFTITGLAATNMVSTFANKQARSNSKVSVTQVQGQILSMVANRGVWNKNLVAAGVMEHPTNPGVTINPELACLREGTLCAETAAGYDLTLLDQNGNIVVDAIDTTKGFTDSGAVCTGYSATTPNPNCSWRLSIKWNPKCANGISCSRPQVGITLAVQSSAGFSASNGISGSAISLTIQQPKPLPTYARRAVLITNSLHYGFPSSIEVDPAAYIVSDSPGRVVISLISSSSALGGTIAMNGQKITYSPAYNISPAPATPLYGADWFNYKVKDLYTNMETLSTVYVHVMTPYTWTGMATTGSNSDIMNRGNFCGKVINGVCDGSTFPGSPFLAGVTDTNLIFNELCTYCTINIGAQIKTASIETTPSFPGVINQNSDVLVAGSGSTWKKQKSFLFSGGTWNGNSGTFIVGGPGERNTCWMCASVPNSALNLLSGTFKAPPTMFAAGDIFIPNGNVFKNNNGTFYWLGLGWYGDSYTGDNTTQFFNLIAGYPKTNPAETNFTVNGWTYGFGWPSRTFMKNNFVVLNTLTVANVGGEAQLATQNSSSIKLYGDYVLPSANASGCYMYGLPATINMIGSADQKIWGQTLTTAEKKDRNLDRANCSPSIVVDKPAGKITVKDTVAAMGDFVLRNAGSYEMDNAELIIVPASYSNWSWAREINLHGQAIENLYFTGGRARFSDDMTINHDFFYMADAAYPALNSSDTTPRTIHIHGNTTFGSGASYDPFNANNAVAFVFDGDSNQTVNSAMVSSPAVGAIGNKFLVDKTSGVMTFNGSLGVMQDFIINNGNTVFGPTFGIHNINTGADYLRTRIQLNAPATQVISKIISNRTIELLSPVHVKDIVSTANGTWVGSHYTNLYGGAFPLYVSGDWTVVNDGGSALMGARTGLQTVIMDGTGPQTLAILGNNVTGLRNNIDLIVQNTTSPVTITGQGQIGKITVGSGATTELNTSSILDITGTVAGLLKKNGSSMTGSVTTTGAGIIQN